MSLAEGASEGGAGGPPAVCLRALSSRRVCVKLSQQCHNHNQY